MKIKAILTMLIMLGGACMYALPDTADAARLGGGRSFGSRPSMSQPAQAPSAMQRQSTQQRQTQAQKLLQEGAVRSLFPLDVHFLVSYIEAHAGSPSFLVSSLVPPIISPISP